MKTGTTALDGFGRVLVPKFVRRELGWRPGTRMRMQTDGRELRMIAVDAQSPLKREKGMLVFTGEADGDLEKAVDADRIRREREIVGLGKL